MASGLHLRAGTGLSWSGTWPRGRSGFTWMRVVQLPTRSLRWPGQKRVENFSDAADGQSSVVWSHDSQRLFTGSGRGDVSIWEMSTGRELVRFHAHPTTVRSLSLSPDGRRLASAGNDHVVKIWDVETRRELLKLSTDAMQGHAVAWSPDGRTLATSRGGMTVWDASMGYGLEKARNNR